MRKETIMNCLKILFTVDLSELSMKIAPHVAKISNGLKAETHVLFVASNLKENHSRVEPGSGYLNANAGALKEAQRYLRRCIESGFVKSRCKAAVSYGDPAEEILKYALKENIDIIVVGSERPVAGHPPHGKMVQRVIRESTADVWTFTADGGPIRELRCVRCSERG
jgi:nucleotide-binding universal stress UspA family protein